MEDLLVINNANPEMRLVPACVRCAYGKGSYCGILLCRFPANRELLLARLPSHQVIRNFLFDPLKLPRACSGYSLPIEIFSSRAAGFATEGFLGYFLEP